MSNELTGEGAVKTEDIIKVSPSNTQKKYDVTLDLLNIFACISVVALHVNEIVHTFSYERYWLTSMVIQVIFYYGVPLFFMISGATLMNYRDKYTTFEYFKKRFVKTVIPFIFWSLVAIYWAVNIRGVKSIDIHDWRSVVNAIINTKAVSIYWFFIPLFACYVTIPFLSLIPKENRQKAFLYLMIVSFILDSVLPTMFKLFELSFNKGLRNPLNGNGYILFLVAGYYFYNFEVPLKYRRLIYALGVLGVATHYVGRVRMAYIAGKDNGIFTGYYNYPAVLAAIAIFVFFKYANFSKLEKYSKIIRTVASASFGIYLMHWYFFIYVTNKFDVDLRTISWRILGVPLIYCSMLILTLIIKKIPIVKNLVP